MLYLSLVYVTLIFIADLGVLQAAAAYNDIHGLSFFPKKIISYLFAVVTIGFSLGVLFLWNRYWATGIIEGAQQAGLFFLALIVALLFTAFAASLINLRRFPETNKNTEGLDALRNDTFIGLLKRRFRKRV